MIPEKLKVKIIKLEKYFGWRISKSYMKNGICTVYLKNSRYPNTPMKLEEQCL